MNAQGSLIVDTAYFDSLTARINAATSGAELQRLVDDAFPSVQAQVSAVHAQIAALAPALELLSLNPASLPSVITFIQKLVTEILTPYLQPYITYTAQLSATVASATALAAAVQSKASSLHVSVTVPTIA